MEKYFNHPSGIRLFYHEDDYTDAWRPSPTIVFVHGFAESSEVWRGWVPYFSRRHRVVRLDLRGFGRSTPMPEDFQWSLDVLTNDIALFISHLGCGPVHLVGAKSGGAMTFKLAAQRPDLVRSLTNVTPSVRSASESATVWIEQIKEKGVAAWARDTNRKRLGSSVSPEEFEWWANDIHGKTPLSTMLSYLRMVPEMDVRGDLVNVVCPTLIIMTAGSGRRSPESYREWQSKIRNSELVVIEGDAYHPSGVYPDRCAQLTVPFVEQH